MATKSLFEGQLVRLAAPEPGDAELFARWSHDAEYLRQVDTDYARPRSQAEFTEQFNRGCSSPNGVYFHLRTLEEDCLIGFAALHSIEWNNQTGVLAIGIGDARYRGKGYGTDAVRLLLNYAFQELNLYRVGLDVITDNVRAIRSYEKAGFRREGEMRANVLRDGVRVGRLIMGILREEWLESK
jgi:RimJ/RimL family protein N-acetyltransferase